MASLIMPKAPSYTPQPTRNDASTQQAAEEARKRAAMSADQSRTILTGGDMQPGATGGQTAVKTLLGQ